MCIATYTFGVRGVLKCFSFSIDQSFERSLCKLTRTRELYSLTFDKEMKSRLVINPTAESDNPIEVITASDRKATPTSLSIS